MAHKRTKVEHDVKERNVVNGRVLSIINSIYSPFDDMDKNVVSIMDDYSCRKIYNFCNHWMYRIGLSDDIQHAFESACTHSNVKFIRAVFDHLDSSGTTISYDTALRIVRKHNHDDIEQMIQERISIY